MFPETPPYLLVIYGQARRGPHSRLAEAGVLTIVLHLGLGQAAAQRAYPVSPAEARRPREAPRTRPQPLPAPLPPDRPGVGAPRETKSPAPPYREWLPSNRLEKNSVNSGLVNPEKQESARGWERRQGINLHKRKLATEEEAGNRGGGWE